MFCDVYIKNFELAVICLINNSVNKLFWYGIVIKLGTNDFELAVICLINNVVNKRFGMAL